MISRVSPARLDGLGVDAYVHVGINLESLANWNNILISFFARVIESLTREIVRGHVGNNLHSVNSC